MNKQEKMNLLKARLHRLNVNDRDNAGVCRKIRREIRRLENGR